MTEDYEDVYESYWKDIVENDDGSLNVDQVKRELADFRHMIREVPKVYSYITGNELSKPNYYASGVIQVAEEYIQQRIAWAIEDYKEDNDDWG